VPDDIDAVPCLVREAHTSIFPRKVLLETERSFRDHCSVRLTPIDPERIEVEVAPRSSSREDARTVCLEFWNYALNLACQHRLELT
jgi:hypothetical protein